MMGRWIRKFTEKARASTDNVDVVDSVSTLSVSNRAHPENISVSLSVAGDPITACSTCGSGQWWQLPGDPWHCRACEPMSEDAAPRATTLTLPCHAPRFVPGSC